eukprot:10318625-Heterocapsa_arctica.AAC.1
MTTVAISVQIRSELRGQGCLHTAIMADSKQEDECAMDTGQLGFLRRRNKEGAQQEEERDVGIQSQGENRDYGDDPGADRDGQ